MSRDRATFVAIPRAALTGDGGGAVDVAAGRRARPAAWWGMMMLIASEGTILVAMIATYLYLRATTTLGWPPRGVPEPAWIAPVIFAFVLAASSVPMQLASRSANQGRVVAAPIWILVALGFQIAYLAYQLPSYRDQLRQVPISTNAYTSIYYTLLGADHAHVVIGVLLSLWLIGKLARGLTLYRVNATLAIAWYWHFINVATLVVTATLLSARL
jgi:heme/copper-type cytochrome/quinol oxidase subunit 3